MIVPVILSGGSGTRLWPLSTAERPKQFLPLIGDESLFKQTLRRVADRTAYHPPVVVANAAHTHLCLDEMAGEDGAVLILEPCARNTAAAIVMARRVREFIRTFLAMLGMESCTIFFEWRGRTVMRRAIRVT